MPKSDIVLFVRDDTNEYEYLWFPNLYSAIKYLSMSIVNVLDVDSQGLLIRLKDNGSCEEIPLKEYSTKFKRKEEKARIKKLIKPIWDKKFSNKEIQDVLPWYGETFNVEFNRIWSRSLEEFLVRIMNNAPYTVWLSGDALEELNPNKFVAQVTNSDGIRKLELD